MIEVYDINKGKERRTHKNIGIDEVIQDAVKNKVDTIAVISAGNYLNSIIQEIERVQSPIRAVNLVNRKTISSLEISIEDNLILRNSEEREKYVLEKMPNAGIVKDYTDFEPQALLQEGEKILKCEPGYISLGIGTGKLFAVIYRLIKEKGLKTKLIGIAPKGENGLDDSNLYEDKGGKMHYKSFNPISVAQKLSAPYTTYRAKIKKAIMEGHILIEVTDKEFTIANKKALSRGYNSEISGSAGFVVFDEKIISRYGIGENNKVIVINTGNGLK